MSDQRAHLHDHAVVHPGGAYVELRQVTKTYSLGQSPRLVATDAVSLRIQAGDTIALTGSSGSGKSTLLHLIGAMDTPNTGTISVDGTDLAGLNRRQLATYRRGIGFVFQSFHLLPALSVEDNILASLLPFKTSFDRRARAHDLINAVGLAGRSTALPSQLSGGQQQRVAIARALINHPRLLLADEPTGNLDTATGADVLDLLLSLQATTGMTVLLATHDQDVAARCDRLIALQDGHITRDTQPGHPSASEEPQPRSRDVP